MRFYPDGQCRLWVEGVISPRTTRPRNDRRVTGAVGPFEHVKSNTNGADHRECPKAGRWGRPARHERPHFRKSPSARRFAVRRFSLEPDRPQHLTQNPDIMRRRP